MKNKLAGHFPLQDALRQTIQEAKMKIAASEKGEEEKSEKKAPPFAKKEKGEKKEEKETEKCSSVVDPQDPVEVEKLASAMEFVSESLGSEKVADYQAMGGESHQGGETIPVQSPASGHQKYPTSKGSKKHQVPNHTGFIAPKDNPGPANAIPTDDNRAPGGNGAKYPAHGVLKTGGVAALQAVVEAELADEETEEEKTAGRVSDAAGKVGAFLKGRPAAYKEAKDWAKASVGKGEKAKDRARMVGYAAKKVAPELAAGGAAAAAGAAALHHKKKKASMDKEALSGETVGSAFAKRLKQNPTFQSASRKSGLEGAIGGYRAAKEVGKERPIYKKWQESRHGGLKQLTPKGFMSAARTGLGYGKEMAKQSESENAVSYLLGKIATVENGGESHQGGEQLSNTMPVKMQPGRSLIQNAQNLKNVTKPEAKSFRKKELAEVLTEPDSHHGQAPNISGNLRSAAKGGVKTAAKRALLSKIASEGCKCTESSKCRHCHLKEAAASLQASAE
jgi:hypothetical protein